MQELVDVEKAVEFCKESEVWVVEISYSLDIGQATLYYCLVAQSWDPH